jgi:hypothetical protein
VRAFYRVAEISPVLQRHGFTLLLITSRGTEIYPTMCDFEKRDVDAIELPLMNVDRLPIKGSTMLWCKLR